MRIGTLDLTWLGRMLIVAEPSCNHVGSKERALRLIGHAKEARADAIKFQVYEADDLTYSSSHPAYLIDHGEWAGKWLWDLYQAAATPYQWLPDLTAHADAIGIQWFASVFSARGLDILEKLRCPAYKIASPEVADARFVELVASAGKPMILSDGMATPEQWRIAMSVVPWNRLVILRCISEYPAPAASYNLRSLGTYRNLDILAGVSDHTDLTYGHLLPIVATTLGACMLEKHLMAEDCDGVRPLDFAHSLAPRAFRDMVDAVREAEAAFVERMLGVSALAGNAWRRRLVAAKDLPSGHTLTSDDIATVRCGAGLEPDEYAIGRTLSVAVSEGEPLTTASFKLGEAA